MKRIVIAIASIAILFSAIFFIYEYVTDQKIGDVLITTNVKDGKPVDAKTMLTTEDEVHVVATQKRFWEDEARIVLYKGEIATANRLDVYEHVAVNEHGYFTVQLEHLPVGTYGVAVFVQGQDIIETSLMFTVK